MCFPLCIGGTSRFIVQTVAFCQCQLNVFIFSIHWLTQNEDWCWIASHWIPRVTLVLSSAHTETHTISSRLKTHRLPVCPTNITKQGNCSHCNENQLLYESTVCGQMKSRGSRLRFEFDLLLWIECFLSCRLLSCWAHNAKIIHVPMQVLYFNYI